MRHGILTLILLAALPASALAQLRGGASIRTGPRVVRPAVQRVEIEEASNPDVGDAWRAIEAAIKAKFDAIGGAAVAGNPRGTIVPLGEGYFQEYGGGRIYYRPDRGAFFVDGLTGVRYQQLGGPTGSLGWPVGDTQPMPETGLATDFENSTIYWWGDTGFVELGDIVVRYTGIHCFGETDWDQSSSADEPYVEFAVVPAFSDRAAAFRTMIYEEVDDGEARTDDIELYRGRPYGMSILINLWEYDFGREVGPHDLTKQAADKGAHAVASASAAVPYVGPALAVGLEALWKEVGEDMVQAIVDDFFDFDDDRLNTITMTITAKEMVSLAHAQPASFNGVSFEVESPLMEGENDQGSTYKAYFVIDAQ